MNARTNQLQLTAEYRQIKDAVSVAFHSIMVHRVLGKVYFLKFLLSIFSFFFQFKFSSDSDYSLGSLGHEEVPCNHVDLTYVNFVFFYSRGCGDRLKMGLTVWVGP